MSNTFRPLPDGPSEQMKPQKVAYSSSCLDEPLDFFAMGMARTVPFWRQPDYAKPILHLGPGNKSIAWTTDCEWPDFDFNDPDCLREYSDDTVGAVIATHVLEHLTDPRNLITEVARVLAPGGLFNILVPHGLSPMYVQDLDHKTPFVLDSFTNLLDNQYYTKGKPDIDLHIGYAMNMAIKEGNVAVVVQLVKGSPSE